MKALWRPIWLCAALALCFLSVVGSAAEQAKSVLILHESESNLPGGVILGNAVREVLQSGASAGVAIYDEYLDLDRFPGPDHKTTMAAFLRTKYAKTHVDVVLATGSRALEFMLQHRAELFVGASLTFDVVPSLWIAEHTLPPDVVGIIFHTDLAPTLKLAVRLQPDARRLVVVSGAGLQDRAIEALAWKELRKYEGRLTTIFLSGLPMKELVREVSRLPRDTIVLYLTIFKDGAGQAFYPRDAAKILSDASSAPVYGLVETFLEKGIVGGHIDTYAAMGREAGRLTQRILAGEHPTMDQLGVADSSADYVNWQQLQRWGINVSRLPPGGIIKFREPPLWTAYRWQIVVVFGLIAILSVLVAALLIQAGRRRSAEVQSAAQQAQLAHLTRIGLLGELSGALAHELSQPLTAILSNAQAAQRFLAKKTPDLSEVRGAIADIVSEDMRAGEVIRHLRSLFKKEDTRYDPINLNAVIAEVQKVVHSELVARQVRLVAHLSPNLAPVRGDHVQLQQVFLNLFINACDALQDKVAEDRAITVSVRPDQNGGALVSIVDNGPGIAAQMLDRLFEPFVTSKRRGLGLGLSVCQSIIRAHGGRLWATNNAGPGATFWISLPTTPEAGR